MELGIQVIKTAKAKMKLVRRYDTLTGSSRLSLREVLDLTARRRVMSVD